MRRKTASVSLRQMLSVFSGKSPCSADGSGKKPVDRLMVPEKSRD
ncbi:hypothetical protein BRYFOR_08811 [Marvinbryantia formatexigens DSM 14469]|uniref:Uncharacterized protein n=1 Tax=Marvinbryantia formatexigens DSM 14469 TaxID=478749 RepID=C6LJH5_9FIRM|nr:hypothetical protein [Marvinbryantia formatexigens]EET59289.1 hypothetical protein BRYFOR_08811 [Marvinbryantia formatexigens DSM 14469]UWO25384.1 hypothetical protein NQ534_02510 [Marvinbryantia formatexigens DSM 14469]